MTQNKIENLQERLFGYRFRGASLASLDWSDENQKKLSDWFKKPKNMLIIEGPPGRSKTYLCAAMLEEITRRFRMFRYHDEKTLFQHLRNHIKEGSDYSTEIPYLVDDEFIILNDMGSAGFDREKYPWREEVWFTIVDELYNRMTPTLITTNICKEEMRQLVHPRLISRLYNKENTLINVENEPDHRQE